MKTYSYPLILTMFAGLTPLVAQLSHFNYKASTYIAPVAALLLVAALPSAYRISLRELVVLSALFFYLLALFLLGIGIGSGGVLIVLVLSVVFKRFSASFRANEIGFERVVHWVLFIYKFNIAYAYVELMLVLAGYQGEFVRLLTTSDQLPGYKDYNQAHFLKAIGFSDVTGLGGIFMGSQAAGMMAVMSLVTFLHLRPYMRHGRRWQVLAMGAVVFCSNMTSLVMLTAAVFLLVFVFESDINRIRYKLLFVVSLPLVTPVIFYKIDNFSEYRIYLDSFLPSINIFLNNLMEFGCGTWHSATAQSATNGTPPWGYRSVAIWGFSRWSIRRGWCCSRSASLRCSISTTGRGPCVAGLSSPAPSGRGFGLVSTTGSM